MLFYLRCDMVLCVMKMSVILLWCVGVLLYCVTLLLFMCVDNVSCIVLMHTTTPCVDMLVVWCFFEC